MADDGTVFRADGIYRARWVVPVSSPSVFNAELEVIGGRICEIRPRTPTGKATDLGDVAVIPGLVNPHTHLEFTPLSQPLGYPGMRFPDWIKAVFQYRQAHPRNPAQIARAIDQGIQESRDAGVVLIGEIASLPWTCPAHRPDDPMLVVFSELVGFTAGRQEQIRFQAEELAESIQRLPWVCPAISPHAPYSTTPDLARWGVERAVGMKAPVAMHLAESAEELELLQSASGPFRIFLESLGLWQDGLFPAPDRILEFLRILSNAPRGLVIHGNYLNAVECQFLAQHKHLSVIYCPRTHAYFDHPRHPIAELLAMGVNVALGTDSRASNPDLNIWSEAQYLCRMRPDLDPRLILEMITWRAARALGQESFGQLKAGSRAHCLSIPSRAGRESDLLEGLFQARPLLAPDFSSMQGNVS